MMRSLPSAAGGAGRLTDWADVSRPAPDFATCPRSAPDASAATISPPAKQPAVKTVSVRRVIGEFLSMVRTATVLRRQGNRDVRPMPHPASVLATRRPPAYTPSRGVRRTSWTSTMRYHLLLALPLAL